MSDDEALFYLVAGLAAGIAAFFYGFVLRQRRKTIESIPTSKARSLAMGLVELQGKAALCGAALVSPFSTTSCVHYRYHIEHYVRTRKRSYWATLARGSTPNRFYLEDETGRVLVEPAAADVSLDRDRVYQGGGASVFAPVYESLGVRWRDAFGLARTLRVTETVIEPGDALYVLGTASLTRTAEGAQEEPVIGKGPGAWFCISDKSERELLESFGLKMYACLYGGPLAAVVCLFLLMSYYGLLK